MCLPTAVHLASKRVHLDAVCQWCNVGQESDIHVLFECVFEDAVWIDIGMKQFIDALPSESIFDLLRRVFDKYNRGSMWLSSINMLDLVEHDKQVDMGKSEYVGFWNKSYRFEFT